MESCLFRWQHEMMNGYMKLNVSQRQESLSLIYSHPSVLYPL